MVQGRQFAIACEGTVITFECKRAGHTYKIDHGKKPLHRRLSPDACKMMSSWWSKEKGGCTGTCPKCEKENVKTSQTAAGIEGKR